MTTREQREHRRKPSQVYVFAPPVVVDVGRAGRFSVARSLRTPQPRKPARWNVWAPPVIVDAGRAGRFSVARSLREPRHRKPGKVQIFAPAPVVDVGRAGRFTATRTRARRPQRHRARYTMLFHTGATPPAPVSGDLRRLLLGVGL